MIPAKVKNFLTKNKIKYDVIKHKTVYTAYDLAQTLKKKLGEVVKALVVKLDKGHAIVVLPASHQVDFKALKKATGASKVDIDRENVMTKLFKVKPGAISAFHGPLHKIPVYVDKAVMKVQKVVAQAGSFEESLHLKSKDLLKVVEGKLANFGKKRK
ncbi:MAG: YbaK/EbsC family protein [Patescibacteria group bacterium]